MRDMVLLLKPWCNGKESNKNRKWFLKKDEMQKYYRNSTALYLSTGEEIEVGSLFILAEGKMRLVDDDLFYECDADFTIFYEVED